MGSIKKERKGITRREFVKGAAVIGAGTAAAGALTSCAPEVTSVPGVPEKWDKEVDVIVVGYGAAGAATATSAHDAGAEVIVFEKMPAGGGNTRVSGGGFLCPTNVSDAVTYITSLFELSHSELDRDLVQVFSEEATKNVEWIKGLREGTEVSVYGHAGFPDLPGADSMNKYRVVSTGEGSFDTASENLFNVLSYAVEKKREIPVMLETSVKRLITNCSKEVIGVVAETQGKEIAIKAKRAVVLTTGGYEYDATMLQNSLKGYPIYALGNPGNTGDGIKMAQKVGAGLWHMNGASCPLGLKVPELEAAFFFFVPAVRSPSIILVDKHGKRFVNERSIEAHAGLLAVDFYDGHATEYPRIPCYAIFDETTRQAGPVVFSSMGYAKRSYTWSKDNSAEIEKGWITKGDTVSELAGKLQMDAATLEQTVTRWNKDIEQEEDTLFGRPMKSVSTDNPAYKELETPVWSGPLKEPPFYAMELHPCLLNTQGGPRRDTAARCLDAFGNPIPRLYIAGELGSFWGIIYQGAGNIGECLVFGRIAGKNAAAKEPWA